MCVCVCWFVSGEVGEGGRDDESVWGQGELQEWGKKLGKLVKLRITKLNSTFLMGTKITNNK